MGQEFVIKSDALETKINQLLPSQGGAAAGVDLSASTTIIPIVDLTESAEGSNLRQDLQKSFSLTSITNTQVRNSTVTLINTTGYFRVFGECTTGSGGNFLFRLTDGTTTKVLLSINSSTTNDSNLIFDFDVFIRAGDSLVGVSNATSANAFITTRQIADINGNLVNP